jgi:aarF domain-containing kinase
LPTFRTGTILGSMKKSIASRSMKLLGLAASVGREELTQTIKEKFAKGVDEVTSGRLKTRLEQAKLIAENLSQLKGAAMKAGQLLSLDAADYFPPEAVEILSKLQGKAEPIEWSIMREVLVEELGEERLAKFEKLSEEAAASASIGQVHKARYLGRNVAVKIQYPGVADSIDSDLKILRTMAQGFVSVSGRKMDLKELFEEFSIVLQQEADYELELKNMARFRELMAPYPEFIVPEPIPEMSAQRVLTMTWENGFNVNDWLKMNPPVHEREQITKMALDLYCKEFFEWGFVQTDPNYANYIIQTRPLKLVLLDFGAALHYTPEFRQEYVNLLKSLATLDRQKIMRSFTEFGLIDERESEEAKENFMELLTWSLEPFQPSRQPFRFRDDDYAKRAREIGQKFSQSLKYSAPPKKILFLHRKLGGIFQLLKKMDVQLDVTPYWNRMVGAEIGTKL